MAGTSFGRSQGSSSNGRAPVSKTGCWGFESLLPCQLFRDSATQPRKGVTATMAKAIMSEQSPKSGRSQTRSSSKTAAKGASGTKGVRAAVTRPSGSRIPRFLREVRVEMSKVTWPSRPDLIQATIVVIIAITIAAAYIGLLDLIWSSLVNFVALG
jgi:preprotein translocase subunit SecE